MARPRLLALAFRVQRLYCLECERIIWRWQGRCGANHTTCKHSADDGQAKANGLPRRWPCSWCGQ